MTLFTNINCYRLITKQHCLEWQWYRILYNFPSAAVSTKPPKDIKRSVKMEDQFEAGTAATRGPLSRGAGTQWQSPAVRYFHRCVVFGEPRLASCLRLSGAGWVASAQPAMHLWNGRRAPSSFPFLFASCTEPESGRCDENAIVWICAEACDHEHWSMKLALIGH